LCLSSGDGRAASFDYEYFVSMDVGGFGRKA